MSENNLGDSMLEMYLFETNTLLEQMDEILLNLEKNEQLESEDVNSIFRIMHTIKGSSAMMEFDSLTKIAHITEDLFDYIRSNGMVNELKDELCDLMFGANDFLKAEGAKVEKGEELRQDFHQFEEEIRGFLERLKAGNTTKKSIEPVELIEDRDDHHKVHIFLEDGCLMEHMRAFMLINNLQKVGTEIVYWPQDLQTNGDRAEEIAANGFWIQYKGDEFREEILRIIEEFNYVKSYEEEKEQQVEEKAEEKIEDVARKVSQEIEKEKAKGDGGNEGVKAKAVKPNLISVDLNKLNTLMDIVGEIVITESMVTSSPDLKGLSLENFNKATRQLRKLTDELQDAVMAIRMVPIAGTFQRMNRIVRDMSKKLNKETQLILLGEDTEVDKTIIDGIADPLMHLVRNSMDHGIEPVEKRIDAGKDSVARIVLSAQNTGGEIVIAVQDDGKGLDQEALLAKAKEKGLLTKPESEYSEREIYHLLMMPGFSTKEQVTEFSGRGVGMDVVKKNIEKVGGTVSIESKKGIGTTTIFKIPLTLAIMEGMEISVGKEIFTIPISSIKQSFRPMDKDIIQDIDGNELVEIRGEYYGILRLHDLYGIETEITDISEGILIQVESDNKSLCLFADKLIGEQQVVVKPLPAYLHQYGVNQFGIAGCTILGDGSISLILEVSSFVNQEGRW